MADKFSSNPETSKEENQPMHKVSPRRFAALIACLVAFPTSNLQAQKGPIPGSIQQSQNTGKAAVLKVFSATSDGHRYVSYLVKWQEKEVVVGDPLGASNYKVGDTLEFIVQKIRLPGPGGKEFAVLAFMVINPKLAEGQGTP